MISRKAILLVPAELCHRVNEKQQTILSKTITKIAFLLLTLLCATTQPKAQPAPAKALTINSGMSNLEFPEMVNYKTPTGHFFDFKGKFAVLYFMDAYKTADQTGLASIDSLQRQFKNSIQFIIVSEESKSKSTAFLKKWNAKHQQALSLPMIVNNTTLIEYFHHHFRPHFVWILPGGKFLASTASYFINKEVIEEVLEQLRTSYDDHQRINQNN